MGQTSDAAGSDNVLASSVAVNKFLWIAGVKVLALFGILINHLAEVLLLDRYAGSQDWLSVPEALGMSFAERFAFFWSPESGIPFALARFAAWVGNEGPGVFILLSGFGLVIGMSSGPGAGWLPFLRRRIGRLYPLYLASVLLFVPVWMLVSSNPDWNMAGWPGLAMLSGIRASAGVFSLLNPSWWFFWTILQLYLVFPLLWSLAQRFGFAAVFIASVIVTVAARLWILQYSGQMNTWPWLTGLFAVSRLAEFTAGMALANALLNGRLSKFINSSRHSGDSRETKVAGPYLVATSGVVFGAGVMSSFTVSGGAVSQLLITVGLTGLLIACWQVLAGSAGLCRAVLRLEPTTYGIYLIHQPPIIIFAKILGQTWLALVVAVAFLITTPWIIRLMELLIRKTNDLFRRSESARVVGVFITLASVLLLLGLPVIEPYLGPGHARNLMTWALSLFFVLGLWFNMNQEYLGAAGWLRVMAVTAAGLTLWVFPDRGAGVACLAAIGAGAFVWLINSFVNQHYRARVAGLIAVLVAAVSVITLEMKLGGADSRFETDRWAELPVLRSHPTRGYALKKDVSQVLSYHYRYPIRTNADGFQGRPIRERPVSDDAPRAFRIAVLGDAFSMPEGVPYFQSYPAILEKTVQHCMPNQSVEVFNLGVTGYSPTEKSALVAEVLPRIEPDLVIDQMFYSELSWMMMTRTERRREIGLEKAPSNDYRLKVKSSRIYQHLLETAGDLTEAYSGLPARWRFELSLVGHFRESGQMNRRRDEYEPALVDFWKAVERKGSEQGFDFVAFYTPMAIEVSAPGQLDYLPASFDHPLIGALDMDLPYRVMMSAAQDAGVTLVDPRSALRNAAHEGAQVYSRVFWHWTAEGHAAAASALTSLLAERGLLAPACRGPQGVGKMTGIN